MSKFSKRIISLATCFALLFALCTISGLTAFADDDDDDGARPLPQSSWEMTVPQIYVYTENGNGTTLEKEDDYVDADIFIKDTDGSVLTDEVSFKVRGNTTALYWVTKKAFTFKFEKKKDVLGMGKGKKWALIANAFDPTLLRNYTVFSLAKELGLPYTSEFKVVELWVDDAFRGAYMLFEPVQEGKDRVNIDIESNDGKKDFLIEYEAQRVEDDVTYFTVQGLRFIASEPEEPDDGQLAYIQSTMDDVITTIRTGNRAAIEEKLDVDSFAKFYLLNEYAKTFDFSMSSVFFYFKDGKLYAGPPWDYDLSLGNTSPTNGTRGLQGSQPEGYYANTKNIYQFLCKHDWFASEVKTVYRQHYTYFENISADGGLLDAAKDTYSDVFGRNYNEAGWRVSKHWINIQKQPLATYDANYDFLKDWSSQRNAWLANEYDAVFLRGDVNGDRKTDVEDVTQIQRLIAEFAASDPDRITLRGDVNGDGRLNISDATSIQRFLADAGNPDNVGDPVRNLP